MTLRGVFHLTEADVQASERLNKFLTLFGDRCPGGSLELRSGRAGLKHFLGLCGYGCSDKRRYKDVKDTARLLMKECLAGWPLIHEVESSEDRFRHVDQRSDIPTLSAAKKHATWIDPVAYPRITPAKLWAATMNAKFSKFQGEQLHNCDLGLIAVSFVSRGKTLLDTQHLFLVCDKVRTAFHLVPFKLDGNNNRKYVPRKPAVICKSHDVFGRFYKMLTSDPSQAKSTGDISVVHVRVHVCEDA